MARTILDYRCTLDECLGYGWTDHSQGLPSTADYLAAIEKSDTRFRELLRLSKSAEDIKDALAKSDAAFKRALADLPNRRIRLCYVVCRYPMVREDESRGIHTKFRVIARPTFGTWMNQRMMDLRLQAQEEKKRLRAQLVSALENDRSLTRKAIDRMIVASISAFRLAAMMAGGVVLAAIEPLSEWIACHAGMRPPLRRVLSAGGKTSAFIPLN